MAITKDKGSIRKWGGGELWYQLCNDTTGVATSSNNWATLGYIQETKLSDMTETEEFADETGNVVSEDEGKRVVKLTGLFMQTDKDTIDFLKETVRGNFYNIYQKSGTLNAKTQEIFYGICRIKPQAEVASGVKRIPFEITVLKNDSAISSIAVSNITGVAATTPTIPASQYYLVVET